MQLVASPELTVSPQTSAHPHPPSQGQSCTILGTAFGSFRPVRGLAPSGLLHLSGRSLPSSLPQWEEGLLPEAGACPLLGTVSRETHFPGLCNKSPQSWRLNTADIYSLTVQKPDVQNPGVGRALLPPKAPGRSPSWMQFPEAPGIPCFSLPGVPISPILASVFT